MAQAVTENKQTGAQAHLSLLATLLEKRGITDKESAEEFLSPDYEAHTHDPFLMKDMDKAVERFLQAVDANEKIIIYSDFDADGIPGGALFHDFLKKIGYTNFENYIPHRNDEGYGFHVEAIEKFVGGGAKLVITIDVGIVAYDEVARAKELGVDVIVTDHHEPNGGELDAVAVLDPKQKECTYPFKELCGAGVAYKFIQAILSKRDFGLAPGAEKWWLDLVGIATLSDMVPLVGENRVFAHYGLLVLRKTPRPGIMQACKALKISQRHMNEDDIGFLITPRINAASRMGHPDDAFALLTADDEVTAGEAMKYLSKINDERKGLVASIVKQVKKKLRDREELSSVIVSGDPSWKPSVLGLVANKLMEEYSRPVFLWGREGEGVLKGSARSNGVSLIALMNDTAHAFEHFGGHECAAGFCVHNDHVHTLEEALSRSYENVTKIAETESGIEADIEMTPDTLHTATFAVVKKLAPFGVGNEKPLFRIQGIVPTVVKTFGKQKNHLEVAWVGTKGIGFFMTPESCTVKPEVGKKVDVLGHLEESFFMGRKERRVRIVDIVS